MKNIVVCVKVVPKAEFVFFDPVKKTLDRSKAENQINEADKCAIETAVRLKEEDGGNVILISMGPPFFDKFLKLGMAMGADDAILLSDRLFAGADTFPTALVLATAIRKIGDVDLVLLGEESSDAGLGQVPGQIAEFLDVPQVLFSNMVELNGAKLRARRTIKGGHETVETSLPAVISMEMGASQPRFPDFKKKKVLEKEFQLKIWSAADLGLGEDVTGLKGSFTTVRGLVEMTPTKRKNVFIEGDKEAKAKKLAELLRPYA